MNIESFRVCCLAQPLATEDMPFDDTVVTFRLKGKIFGCLMLDKPDLVVLKCEPERAEELRMRFPAIEGAYHWNKRYWNQIRLDGSVSDRLMEELVRHAWEQVNLKLPKIHRVVSLEQTSESPTPRHCPEVVE
ncbi:MAG: MmcQ/YjbR family DNA-binding protein [Bacteroidales bacterium]|nr:MmcQ/YjbR family DNA-binding protein [Bacteroidales bacterium]